MSKDDQREFPAHQHSGTDSKGASSTFSVPTNEKIIRLPAVKATVGLSRATIYRLIRLGDFPKPVKLGLHASGWLESSIQSWIRQRAGQQWV